MTRLAVRMGRPRAVLYQGVAALALVVPVAGCTNSPHLAGGPIVVGPEPVRVEFHEAVPVLGPTWELCLEFDRPRDSHGARSIDAVLIDTEGGRVPLGSPPVYGREAIRKHYAGQGGSLALRAFAYAVDGAVATILGGYTSTRGTPDAGKFTLTLRRAHDGPWRIVSDMDNGNSRP